MQNVLALAPAIARMSGFGSAAGKGRAGMVDARDVGAVAAEIAASPAPHTGKTYRLTGPELISNYAVAAVLWKLLGRAITYTELSCGSTEARGRFISSSGHSATRPVRL